MSRDNLETTVDESGDILVLGSQGTQQITENTFPISHHPDWQIDLVQRWGPRPENKDFGFVSHTDVTRSLLPSVAQEMDSLGRRVIVLPWSSFFL